MAKLTDKQARFVEEYLVDLNATQAAIRAGYSEKTANEQGPRLLVNVSVSQAIAKAQLARSKRTEVTQDRVVKELAKIAFADIRQAVRWGKSPIDTESENAEPNGLGRYPVELVPSEEIDDDIAAAVSEVSLTQAGIKIKMHDKKGALVDLGKHLGMFVERKEIGAPGEFAQLSDAELERREREIDQQLQEFEGGEITHSPGEASQATH